MADEKPALALVKPPSDAADLTDLWLDPALGDGLTDTCFHNIPVGKPKDFFRVHPGPDWRRRAEIYTHKPEGQIEEQNFIIAKPMLGRIEEARTCTLVVCIYRDGSLRLWALKSPKAGEKDNPAWTSARAAARSGMTHWVRLVWVRNGYLVREAEPGYVQDTELRQTH